MFRMTNHTIAALFFLSLCGVAVAADVNLNGVIGTKALVVIDSGKPRLLAVGETSPEGVKLISVAGESAVIEMGGKRERLTLGQSARLAGGSRPAGGKSVTLLADSRGHFVTIAAINGITVRVLVDTGASLVSMSSSEAKRLGINYTAGQKAFTSTANGVVPTYRVKIDEVRIGDVTLNNVDGMVHVGDNLPIVLLGMSFLNRMDMKRDGEKMVLTKRF
ncbi:MAG: TIGR02281 family clan AA aspartic protease [Betaproteobacteria bacterium]|nr:TIGR02281 family clan AA aspartic protease [Betaproteobacteria bacterium]MBI2290480.1 TIGR02281 family clan AA aspartic protease [Betaproteobacteria bacterium]MBI3054414.1 TIGR02281 family clan AA aspartic protease [Betaproteobacteria bacterium]